MPAAHTHYSSLNGNSMKVSNHSTCGRKVQFRRKAIGLRSRKEQPAQYELGLQVRKQHELPSLVIDLEQQVPHHISCATALS